jgi:hypothetical protein
VEEGDLAEHVTGNNDRDCRQLASRRARVDGEPAARNKVERVCGVVLVEHDLASPECPASRDLQQPTDIGRRHPFEHRPM